LILAFVINVLAVNDLPLPTETLGVEAALLFLPCVIVTTIFGLENVKLRARIVNQPPRSETEVVAIF